MKNTKGMIIAHRIITFALLGVVVWLVVAELKRMKTNKEIAQNTAPATTPTVTE